MTVDHDHDGQVAMFGSCPTCDDATLQAAFDQADEAIAQVEANADQDWLAQARAVVRDLAATRREFTSDDLWRRLPTTREPRALGAVMRWATGAGLVENTHQTVPSTRPECHARPVTVWRSRRVVHHE